MHDIPNKEYTNWRNKKGEITFITAFFELDLKQKNHLKTFYSQDVDNVSVSRRYDGICPIVFYKGDSEVEVKNVTKTEGKDGEEKEITYNPRNYILREIPKFVYYSNYGNLDAQIYLPHAVKLLNGEKVEGFNNDDKVRTLRVLFDYVGLEPEEVLELGKDPQEYTHYSGSQYTKKKLLLSQLKKRQKAKRKGQRC